MRGRDHLATMICGLDYKYVRSQALYRQLYRHQVRRAQELGVSRIFLGWSAELEKRRFGARPHESVMYLKVLDSSVLEELGQLESSLA